MGGRQPAWLCYAAFAVLMVWVWGFPVVYITLGGKNNTVVWACYCLIALALLAMEITLIARD